MRLTEKQMDALRTLDGHGNTMKSLHRLRLIRRDPDHGWALGIRGELILAGWTLGGLEMLDRHNELATQERA